MRPNQHPRVSSQDNFCQAGLGGGPGSQVSCLLSPFVPKCPRAWLRAGVSPQGQCRQTRTAALSCPWLRLGLADLTVTRRHGPFWVGPLNGWVSLGLGPSFARSRERRQRTQMDHAGAQLASQLLPGLAGLGGVELAPESCHHKPGLKLNCRVLGRPGGSGQPGSARVP